MDNRASYIPSADLGAHPAVRAWSRLCGEPARPRGIEVIRAPHKVGDKPCIFRIRGLEGENSSIVSKLCLKETAQFERLIYKTVLPELPLPSLEFYGTVASENPAKHWVFVEDAGDERYSPKVENHRHLAAEWIATLHTAAETLPEVQPLPDRGPDHYLNHLRSARRRIEASRSNRVITSDQRAVLDRIDAYLQSFEDSWNEWKQLCETMPRTLAHGDWAAKNARFRSANGRRTLVVFDWETAGSGVPAVDLASSRIYTSPCCLRAYLAKVRESWPSMGFEDILRMATVGRLFRVIAAIDWESTDLVFEQLNCLTSPLTSMQTYLDRIEELGRELRGGQVSMTPARKVFPGSRSLGEGSVPIANELRGFLSGGDTPGPVELRKSLDELLGDQDAASHVSGTEKLARGVYRLRFGTNGTSRSLVVKHLDPEIAKRNSLVARRWLPAIGLGHCGPPLLSSSAERNGQRVWHIYEDLGKWGLQDTDPDPQRTATVVELIAKLHARFVGHPLLAECRLWGGAHGVHSYSNSVHDAIANLERLRTPYVELSSAHSTLRDRLLRRLHKFQNELPRRLEEVREFGGPETLLHGDLWPQNAFVIPTRHGLQARIIDWDRTGVGPVIYDLSTLLSRFPAADRAWILDAYRRAPETPDWRMPSTSELNLLFETAESSRLANCVIWPAIEAQESQAAWAFEELKEIDKWFEALQPLLRV